MGRVESRTLKGELALSAGSGFVSAFVGFVTQRVLAAWEVLDEFAANVGRWLKMNLSVEDFQLAISALLAVLLWCGMLWLIWRRDKVSTAGPLPIQKFDIAMEPAKPTKGLYIEGMAGCEVQFVTDATHSVEINNQDGDFSNNKIDVTAKRTKGIFNIDNTRGRMHGNEMKGRSEGDDSNEG